MSAHIISCRARVASSCLDGQPTRKQFGDNLPMAEDGTYDGASIVCDACYIALMPLTPSGRGLNHELGAAIAVAKGSQS